MTHSRNYRAQPEIYMNQQNVTSDPLVLSYLALRKAVGIVGFALPFALGIGGFLLSRQGIQITMSDYYYTGMRNIFVASLCTIGIFLMSTRGYDLSDEITGRLAATFAVGIALFPTTPAVDATSRAKAIGSVHLSCAALFYLTVAFISIVLFTKTSAVNVPTPQKLQRNAVYRVCGYSILACIFLILIYELLPDKTFLVKFTPVFWLESVASMAFGVSWLVKGETILKDQ
jgi:hypothetical protein